VDTFDCETRRHSACFIAARYFWVIGQRREEELQRHNRVIEGRSVYLASYKRGQSIAG